MARDPSPVEADADAALEAWRLNAANALLAAMALAFLPTVALNLLGHGPAATWPVRLYTLLTYAAIVAGALLRRTGYRLRLWVMVCLVYGMAIVATVVLPTSPARAFPIWLPVVVGALLGRQPGRRVAMAGALVVLFVPLLRSSPAAMAVLGAPSPRDPAPPGFAVVQAFTLVAMMATLLIVVERSQDYLVRALANQRRATADLEREMEERRRLEREMARIGDEDRRRLGQEVHDGVCQELTGALLRCQALDRRVELGGTASRTELATLTGLLEEALNDAHGVARGLWPLDPDPGALVPALRSLVRRVAAQTGAQCEFRPDGDGDVCQPEVAQQLYRIAQEALSNAARHAHANRITVEFRGCEDHLVLTVEDDGSGIVADTQKRGMGLSTMAHRARIADGELRVEPLAEGGTRVTCTVPRPLPDPVGGGDGGTRTSVQT